MPNPFFGNNHYNFLTKYLNVKSKKAKWLVGLENISVQVVTRGNHTHYPRTMDELHIFTRSILTTLRFSHSRNVSNQDLFRGNSLFDGEKVYVFDWNDGVVVEGMRTPLVYYDKVPPECKGKRKNENFHINPWAYDMWIVGGVLKSMLKSCCHTIEEVRTSQKSRRVSQAEEMFSRMVDDDPYKRPDANELLRHPFLQERWVHL